MNDSRRRFKLPGSNLGLVEKFIAINVVIWFATNLFENPQFFSDHFALSLANLKEFRVYTLFTFGFMHNEFPHLAINMFVFYFLGRALEREWSTQQFVVFYLVASVVGGLFFTLEGISPLSDGVRPVVGASASVFGMLVAYAMMDPNRTILLMFVIPMKLRTLAYGLMVFETVRIFVTIGDGNTSSSSHLGGAVAGLLYGMHLTGKIRLPLLTRKRRRRSTPKSYSRARAVESTTPPPPRVSAREERKLDELLSKVTQGGLDSLTPAEREFMISVSRKMRDK